VQLQWDLASTLGTLTSIVTKRTTIYVFCIILQYRNPRLTRWVRPVQGLIRVVYRVVVGGLKRLDYGTITLLFQDHQGGLEVLSPNGDFVPATPIPETIIVNAGDLLQRWSNDVIKSTEHRVVSPPTPPLDDQYPARYSIAYFCNPNWDATIECLEGCYGDAQGGKTRKYSPINTHEYLVSRLRATY